MICQLHLNEAGKDKLKKKMDSQLHGSQLASF